MNRTIAGSRPLAASQRDASYLDFIEGMRFLITTQLLPEMQRKSLAALEEAFNQPGPAPRDLEEVGKVVDAVPIVPVGQRMHRTVQEMIWRATYDTLHKQEADLVAALDAADLLGPGT